MASLPVVNPLSAPQGVGASGGLAFYEGSTQTASASGALQPQAPSSSAQPGGVMQPNQFSVPSAVDDDFENEPPILEELGIDIDLVFKRMKGIALFRSIDEETLRNTDMFGPIMIYLAMSFALNLQAKFLLGNIYGFMLLSTFSIAFLINAMDRKGGIDVYRTCSIIGYGCIPVVFLSLIGVGLSLRSTLGMLLSAICIIWSTASSSRFFAAAVAMHQQRFLLAYPLCLCYTIFTLFIVF